MVERTKGFTLIELMFVILVIAIISLVAVPSFKPVQTNVSQEARRVLNDVRYAQALSMTTGLRYRWVRASSSSYQILNESGVAMVLPTGGTTLVLRGGVTMTTNLPSNLIAFDSMGTPYVNTLLPGTVLSTTASITLTGGGQTQIVQILPQTGYGAVS